jgi:Na+/melibiose symporter-like transporter
MAENAFDDMFVLRVLYAIAPAVFFIGAIIIALRFPLTAKVQAELQARIKSAQNV